MKLNLQAHDARAVVEGLAELDFCELSKFNNGSVGVYWASEGTSPWELHPNDDEFLFVVDGEVEITVLTTGGPCTTLVKEGSFFIVPRGHWHKQRIVRRLQQLWVTPGETRHSEAEDPREGA